MIVIKGKGSKAPSSFRVLSYYQTRATAQPLPDAPAVRVSARNQDMVTGRRQCRRRKVVEGTDQRRRNGRRSTGGVGQCWAREPVQSIGLQVRC